MKPPKSSLPALTSLRFFAALVVVCCHYFVKPMGGALAGVEFFFVLSGFILAYNHAGIAPTPGAARQFWFRRFARIYPTHLLTLLVSVPVASYGFRLSGDHLADGLRLGANTLLVQSFVPRLSFILSFNWVAWSISCEAFFYLLFPLVVPVLLRQPPRLGRALAGAPLLVVVWCAGLWTRANWPASLSAEEPVPLWLFYFLPLSRFAEFLAGVWLGLAYAARPWQAGPWRQGAALLAWVPTVVGAALATPWCGPLVLAVWYFPASLLTLYAFAPLRPADRCWGRLFASRWLLRLGEASFMLYMTHLLLHAYAVRAMSRYLHVPYTPGWQFNGLLVGVAIGVALAGHALYERPAQRLLVRWWRRSLAPIVQPTR